MKSWPCFGHWCKLHFRSVFPHQKHGRGGEIRTHDLLYPKQARYQATLRPDTEQEKVAGAAAVCNRIFADFVLGQRPRGIASSECARPRAQQCRNASEPPMELDASEQPVLAAPEDGRTPITL